MKKVNSDVAYEHIRRKILSGEFLPGQPLLTEALSAEVKLSRTSVREALHKLTAEGLVSISPHVGASVKKMDLVEFREMCDLRLALEGRAAALAALNRSQADLREIKASYELLKELTGQMQALDDETPLMRELQRADVRFHIAVMAASKNSLMKREILRLHLVNRVVIGPMVTAQTAIPKTERDLNRRKDLESHQQIYEAINRADERAARDAMEHHILDVIESSIQQMGETEGSLPSKISEEDLAYIGQ